MPGMFELNNREISILGWLSILFIWGMTNVAIRGAAYYVLRAFLQRPIILALIAMAAYIAACVWFLAAIDLWHWNNLKTTLAWALTFALATMFDINRITEDQTYLHKTIQESFAITAFIIFVTERYTFSLPAELLLTPILFVLTIAWTWTEKDQSSNPLKTIAGWALTTLAIIMFWHALSSAWVDWGSLATTSNGLEFAVPIMLSILFLPFIHFASLYAAYEKRFVFLSYYFQDRTLFQYARRSALKAFKGDLDAVRRWAREVSINRVSDRIGIDNSIRHVQQVKEREASPSNIPASAGWSPYLAMTFLHDENLRPGDYHRMNPEQWIADGASLRISKDSLFDNIAYYVEGDEEKATRLTLTLDVDDRKNSRIADTKFFAIAKKLVLRSTGVNITEKILKQSDATIPVSEHKVLRLSRKVWRHHATGAYERELIIEHVNCQ